MAMIQKYGCQDSFHMEIQKKICMECPPCLKAMEMKFWFWTSDFYGLVHSACKYYKKAVGILKKLGSKGGEVDPYFFVHNGCKGTMFIAVYVDNNLMIGDKVAINEAIQQPYLSCNIVSTSRKIKPGMDSHIWFRNLSKNWKYC